MSIGKYLDKIRNAVYGREVRESIAKGIETAYNDAAEKHDNANMEVKLARGTNPNLNTRLNKMDEVDEQTTTQLAQTAREATRKRELEDLSPNVLKAIEGGEGTSFNLLSVPQDNSVTPAKTTYASGGGGVNLWDGTFVHLALSGNSPYSVIEGANFVSVVVKLIPSTSYTFSKSLDTDRFRIGIFEEYPTVDSEPTHYFTNDTTPTGVYTYSTKSNEVYGLIFLSSVGDMPSEFQVEKGKRKTEYVDPNDRIIIPLDEKSIPKIEPKMTSFFRQSHKNLFNGNWLDGHLSGNPPNELVLGSGKYTVVEVEPDTTYTISKSETDRLALGFFDHYPYEDSEPEIYQSPGTNSWTFTTKATTKYIVVVPTSVAQSKEPDWFQIEKGEVATPYEHPFVLKDEYVSNLKDETKKTNFVINGNFNAEYKPFTTAPTMDTSLKLDVVYAWFDDLITRFPEYVSKSLLATESSGLPIYRYDFIPPITGGYTETLPKILHVTGIHGSEKQSIGSGMRFYKDLCDHWKESGLLELLRWNIHFIVIPAFNAWGVENDTRGNANGVNLNRNFPNNWKFSDVNYDSSGSEPLSELESQAMMNLLETEENIIFAIDHHRYNPFAQDDYTMWTGTKNETMNKYLAGWSRNMNADFIKTHPELTEDNGSYVYLQETYISTGSGWLSFSFVDHGIPGTILEISLDSNLSDYHTHALGHLFAYATKELHNNKRKWID